MVLKFLLFYLTFLELIADELADLVRCVGGKAKH